MTHLSADWTFQGFPLIRLENDLLRVEVLPSFGGKIWTLEHRGLHQQFLWHHPRHRLRPLPLGASYDDHFFGGFDELLPNDVPEIVNGESLVDHGELWTTPLEACIEGERLNLWGQLPITPLAYRKTMYLEANTLCLETQLANTGRRALDVLWKLHPALNISPGTEIRVPAKIARVADPAFSRVPQLTEFNWSERETLHRVPEFEGSNDFFYLLDLSEGACELAHHEEDWRFRLTFPLEIFSSVWVFAAFGGWRDLEVLLLEPCTTPQLSLVKSSEEKKCLHLDPGASVTASIRVETGRYGEA